MSSKLVTLPTEIKFNILKYLGINDLKSMSRVCRILRDVVQDPQLWKKIEFKVSSRSMPFIKEILNLKRLQLIEEIQFGNTIFAKKADETLNLIANLTRLTSLDVSGSKLSDVRKQTLRLIVKKMRKLNVQNCRLSYEQLDEIFDTLSGENSCIEELMIGSNNLSKVSSELLRKAVSKLKLLHCDNCFMNDQISNQKISEMLKEIDQCSTCMLENLNLNMNSMLQINFTLISSLSRLRIVSLYGCDTILAALLENLIQTENISLKDLNIGNSDLTLYPPSMVSKSLVRLETVNLSDCDVTPMHVTMLLTSIATKESVNLKKLVMTGIDYSTFVDIPGLVEKAKEKLVHFELSAKYI